ncbi:MAG: HEAT repeat domain-containing protein [Deltaproteobacteria bacterium]|nr:MAG: HEAT repeat domain-containing protein [Deltaproteobacteria bacterium]
MSWTSTAPTTRPAPFRRSTTAPFRRERTCFRWRFAPASVHRRCKAAEWARYVSPNVYAVVTLTVVPLVLACARPSPPPRSRFATLPAISAEIADSLQRIELARVPDVEARALLTSHDAAVRIRAALAVGRIGDAEAAGALRRMLDDPEAGEMAAWALGRIDGGRDALISCLAERCPASRAAARPLSGPVALGTGSGRCSVFARRSGQEQGRQGLAAEELIKLADVFHDDWRVRVEVARSLATAAGGSAILRQVWAG